MAFMVVMMRICLGQRLLLFKQGSEAPMQRE